MNIIKTLEQQLLFRLLEERKQYMNSLSIDYDYMKKTNDLMRILADEKASRVADEIRLSQKVAVMDNVTGYKQILN